MGFMVRIFGDFRSGRSGLVLLALGAATALADDRASLVLAPLEVERTPDVLQREVGLRKKFTDLAAAHSGAQVLSPAETATALAKLPKGQLDFAQSDVDLGKLAASSEVLYALYARLRVDADGRAVLVGRVVRSDGVSVAAASVEMRRETERVEVLLSALTLQLFLELRTAALPPTKELAMALKKEPTQLGGSSPTPTAGAPAEPSATAPSTPPETDQRTREVFAAARRLYGRKSYAEAIVKFQEAYATAAHPAILYNIGKCHERLGDYGMALRYFREYLRLDPKATSDAAVKADIATGEKHLRERGVQQLVIFAEPASSRIVLDRKPLSPPPAYVELRAGPHELRVSADGYEPEERQLTTSIESISEVRVALQPLKERAALLPSDAPLAVSLTPARGVAEAPGTTTVGQTPRKRVATWICAGVAGAAAITATGFGVTATMAAKDANVRVDGRTTAQADELVARARNGALASNVSWGVAGATAVAAVILYFVEGRAQ